MTCNMSVLEGHSWINSGILPVPSNSGELLEDKLVLEHPCVLQSMSLPYGIYSAEGLI